MRNEVKDIMTTQEVVEYTGFSRAHVYRLQANGQILGFKPGGRKLFFRREDLRQWVLTNKNEV